MLNRDPRSVIVVDNEPDSFSLQALPCRDTSHRRAVLARAVHGRRPKISHTASRTARRLCLASVLFSCSAKPAPSHLLAHPNAPQQARSCGTQHCRPSRTGRARCRSPRMRCGSKHGRATRWTSRCSILRRFWMLWRRKRAMSVTPETFPKPVLAVCPRPLTALPPHTHARTRARTHAHTHTHTHALTHSFTLSHEAAWLTHSLTHSHKLRLRSAHRCQSRVGHRRLSLAVAVTTVVNL